VQPSPGNGRQRFDIGDIVRAHRSELEARGRLSRAQRRVLSAIELCRTAALGGHVDVCRCCDFERPAYNSCRNRHCPKCQALRQEQWIAARAERLIPVPHFHVVLTLPGELRTLARRHPREVFGALFAAASETLLELGASRLQALLGITMVLHTWTRDLRFHPHVHALVTAGGLANCAALWAPSNSKYLFPVKVMGQLLRGKMLEKLRSLHHQGLFDSFLDFGDPEAFDRFTTDLARKSWVVYAKKPFRRAEHVLAYLGRYTHRVGIANSRLLAVTDSVVTFRTKNGKAVSLSPIEFLSRFVQHVLPDRFHKIRHFGLYAGASDGVRLKAMDLLATTATPVPATPAAVSVLQALTLELPSCPGCGAPMERRAVPAAISRAPPRTAVA